MSIANLASEMGAKNAVFPADEVLSDFLGERMRPGVWADPGAKYALEMEVDLTKVFPVVAAPHAVENVKAVAEVEGTKIQEAVIGTCTSGRLEDLRVAASILAGKKLADGVQLMIIPASQEIYLKAIEEGIITTLVKAGGDCPGFVVRTLPGDGPGHPG